jgi:NitT/TauT family transport system substrate-binding protein
MKCLKIVGLALALVAPAVPSDAAESVNLILN